MRDGRLGTSIALHHATIVQANGVAARPLFVERGRIVAEAPPGAWPLDLRGHLIFPGLINAHDHLQLNNIPHLPAHAPFPNSYEWMLAFQPFFQEPEVARACAVPEQTRFWQGGLKNLLCGATTVAHHDPWRPILDEADFPVRLLRDFGWSHSLGLGMQNEELRIEKQNGYHRRNFQFSIFNSQLPHYGPPVVESFCATPFDRPWVIHLAEGTDALARSELAQLDALGCLAANTVLVHGVGLSSDDLARASEVGAAVIWCPASNLALLGATLDPRPLFVAGRLALGSDSRISGARDLLDELRVAAECSCLTPAELLRLVTGDASRVLALPEVGGLAPGQSADLLILRDTGHDPYQTLLELDRADIRAVVRDGVPLVADLDFADWFATCGIATVGVMLDGRPKLLARALARHEAIELEPGLESYEL